MYILECTQEITYAFLLKDHLIVECENKSGKLNSFARQQASVVFHGIRIDGWKFNYEQHCALFIYRKTQEVVRKRERERKFTPRYSGRRKSWIQILELETWGVSICKRFTYETHVWSFAYASKDKCNTLSSK